MRSFEAGDDHDDEGTSASIGQISQSSAVDILKKHQSKGMAPLVNRLPDPRAMAEIRSGLEDKSYKAEMVRNSWYFPIFLQLNTAMFSFIVGSQSKYGVTVVSCFPLMLW